MGETRKMKHSWQLKAVVALLVVAPIISGVLAIIKKSTIPTRGIASVSKTTNDLAPVTIETASMDLSKLSPAELKSKFKYQLLRDARATLFQDSINLSLGLFFVQGGSGNKVSVCERYPQIQMTIHSKKTTKVIESACNVSDDQNHIEATAINFESAENTEWKITEVKLLSNHKEDFLEVSPKEISSVLGQEIAVESIHE